MDFARGELSLKADVPTVFSILQIITGNACSVIFPLVCTASNTQRRQVTNERQNTVKGGDAH